jgi:hypothetical protein
MFWYFLSLQLANIVKSQQSNTISVHNNKIITINIPSMLTTIHFKGTTIKITLKSISLHIDVLQFN